MHFSILAFAASTTAALAAEAQYQWHGSRKDTAQVFDNLWARHWNKWMTPVKTNLFAVNVSLAESGAQNRVVGEEVNLMQGLAPAKDPLLRWEVEA
ncbi:hypothetical protein IWW50_003945 [Coemansia erecta]|nr:hypothetical protein IWW50_003945 [Coemansia erecta]